MPKGFTASKSTLKPDARYNSPLASKFINCLMHDGKKSVAQQVFYGALEIVSQKMADVDPIEVFKQAVENVKPVVEVRSRRVGGANYQVPVEVSGRRQRTLAFRWILEAARGKKGRPLAKSLSEEIVQAYNREGGAMMKRDNTHKQAEANKAFAHFAW